ncbi:hypothetical protein ACTWPB_15585 [Nocardia sp. IBHARD005]|uniref:hypothetical protein n=1 Tax=Nocardia sp. IBHARD005 TaxID=3457765 RepID=UPI004058CBFA
MKHSDELNSQPAVRRDQSSGASAICSADTVPATEATHNQSRAELVRALEAMAQDGWIKTAPAAPTAEATDAATALTGEWR